MLTSGRPITENYLPDLFVGDSQSANPTCMSFVPGFTRPQQGRRLELRLGFGLPIGIFRRLREPGSFQAGMGSTAWSEHPEVKR